MKRRVPMTVQMAKFVVGFKLTPIGRVAVLGIFLSAIGGVTVEIPIYQIFSGLICLFGIIEATGILLRPKLTVDAWLPEKVTAGESVTGYITIINHGWLPACDIMCAFFGMPRELRHTDPDLSVRYIPSGEQARLPFTIEATTRGDYLLPEGRIHSTFPFNLMRFGKAKVPERELRVLPTFFPLEILELPISRKSHIGEMAIDSRLGDSPEYVGNRDYVSGEPVRRLDFKAWARVGRPVVREYQDEFNSDVAILLDTFLPARWWTPQDHRRRLEAAVSLTAAIAHYLDHQDATIQVFLAAADLYFFQPSAATSHFHSVLDILSDVTLVQHDSIPQMLPTVTESLETVAIVICILTTWNESRDVLIRQIVESGCAVRIFIVADPRQESLLPGESEHFSTLSPKAILQGEVREL